MRTEPSFSEETESNLLNDIDGSAEVSASQFGAETQLLSDYRQRYGLSTDPFEDDPHFPFYTGAQRRQVLEQLLHLCQFGQNLLLVTGDYGVGKTRMAQALIDSLDDEDDICFVEGQVTSSIDSVLADVFAQFELSTRLEFTKFCEKVSDKDGLVVLIVDNAHHLAENVLAELVDLLQENAMSRLHMVLFAEPHLLGRLDNIEAPNLVLTDLELGKFSLIEAVDYLNFRMEMADYLGPEVFTESKVEPWWRQSQGQLLALHEFAQEKLLASVSPATVSKLSKSNQLIPHIVATSVLVAGLGLFYLYLGNDSAPESSQPVVQSVDLPKPALQQSSVEHVVAARKEADNVGVTVAAASSVTDVSVNEDAELASPVVKQSVVPLAEMKESVSAPVQIKQPERIAEIKSVGVSSAATQLAVKPKVEAASLSVPKQKVVFTEQEKQILAWGETEYTLQLVGLSNEKAARDFVAAQPNKKDLLMFKSQRQNKDWFVVVTGRFQASAKAREAIKGLPAAQQQAAPWPREVKVIQQEIKQQH